MDLALQTWEGLEVLIFIILIFLTIEIISKILDLLLLVLFHVHHENDLLKYGVHKQSNIS